MKHNFIDRYAALDSPLHLLDARTKIVGFLALIVAVLLVPAGKSAVLFGFFFLVAVLAGVSQIPLGFAVGRTLVLLPFILLAGLGARWNGLDAARLGVFVTRSILCLLLLILLTNTTRFSELLRGLRRLGCPRVLALNLGFLYRYLFVLTDEALRMRQARDCRRVGRAPAPAELRLLGSMLGTLLVRSFERGDRMYQAMLSRAFAGEFGVLDQRRFGWLDLAFLAGVALAVGAAYHFALRP
jgi:cobalt/nickel transport system permease protein